MKNLIFLSSFLLLFLNIANAQTPLSCVINSPANGYEAAQSTLNGFSAFNNKENGYLATANNVSGFFAISNLAHGFNSVSNTLDGFNANNNGVNGFSATNNTFNGFSAINNGGYGIIAEGNTSHGIYSHNNGGDAGHFSGNVQVIGDLTVSGPVSVLGTLSKSMGSFKIDHPLDPENKYLYHSFVESPDMMNIYNGNIVLDNNGTATVELPNYFEALNMEFRYQLTCIGGFAQVYISEEIDNNTFSIAGGAPNMKVSWQVTGVRQDPFANKNRLEVEVEKPTEHKGYYLHPEVYEKGKEKSIQFAKSKKY